MRVNKEAVAGKSKMVRSIEHYYFAPFHFAEPGTKKYKSFLGINSEPLRHD